jgi:hypothetical protein
MRNKENHSEPENTIMTTEILEHLTENALLKLAATLYECNHENEDALYEFARLTGKSKKHFEQVAGGKGSPGFIAWLIIESKLPMPIYSKWCSIQREKKWGNTK